MENCLLVAGKAGRWTPFWTWTSSLTQAMGACECSAFIMSTQLMPSFRIEMVQLPDIFLDHPTVSVTVSLVPCHLSTQVTPSFRIPTTRWLYQMLTQESSLPRRSFMIEIVKKTICSWDMGNTLSFLHGPHATK